MCRYKAYQLEPEFQESPLWRDYPESFSDISVFGNSNYHTIYSCEVRSIMRVLDDEDFRFQFFEADTGPEKAEVLRFWFGSRLDYLTNDEMDFLIDYIAKDDLADYARIFSLITGHGYGYRIIRGSCQGEWNYCFYREAEWTEHYIDWFEIEYFNLGDEWIVTDEEYDSDPGISYYTHEWNDLSKKTELADMLGCGLDDIAMFEFVGYKRTPEYRELIFSGGSYENMEDR